ncbi:MAG: hypothetical protein WA108_12145 [Thiobacillus sp.]|jgi:hypothetical protein
MAFVLWAWPHKDKFTQYRADPARILAFFGFLIVQLDLQAQVVIDDKRPTLRFERNPFVSVRRASILLTSAPA